MEDSRNYINNQLLLEKVPLEMYLNVKKLLILKNMLLKEYILKSKMKNLLEIFLFLEKFKIYKKLVIIIL